jgi:hypothetical protein
VRCWQLLLCNVSAVIFFGRGVPLSRGLRPLGAVGGEGAGAAAAGFAWLDLLTLGLQHVQGVVSGRTQYH